MKDLCSFGKLKASRQGLQPIRMQKKKQKVNRDIVKKIANKKISSQTIVMTRVAYIT